jgi:DNA-binding CsgD family transcriptional regulator
VTEMLHEHPVQEMRYPRLTLAEIYVARGQYLAAEAESAIWQRLPESARRFVVDGLDLSDGSADVPSLLRLCAVGLRAAGDVPSTTVVPEGASADELWGRCRGAATDPPPRSVIEAYSKLCLAERARAGGAGTVALWTDAADAWNAVKHPYPAAYADWRTAEAAANARDFARATTAARAAYATAVRLAAEPLRKQIEAVATYGRLDLTGDGGSAAAPKQPSPAAREANPFGLTKREREVLKHLCVGDKNIKIAADLKIAEATVGVHVSRILTKLGVENRTQAAAKAFQLDLC